MRTLKLEIVEEINKGDNKGGVDREAKEKKTQESVHIILGTKIINPIKAAKMEERRTAPAATSLACLIYSRCSKLIPSARNSRAVLHISVTITTMIVKMKM